MLGEPALSPDEKIICLDSNGASQRADFVAYSLNDIVNTQDKTLAFAFECTTPGTTDFGETAFAAVTAAGQTVTDGTVVWTARDPFIWGHPMITAERAAAAYNANLPTAKEIWGEKNHLESKPSSNLQIAFGCEFDEIPAIYRVDKTNNEYSPTRTDGSSNVNFSAGSWYDIAMNIDAYWHGFRFECGDAFQVLEPNTRFEDCIIKHGLVIWPAALTLKPRYAEFLNTSIIANAQQQQYISLYSSGHMKVIFQGCLFDVDNHPNGYINNAANIAYQILEFNDCDMGSMTNPGLVDSSDFSLGSDTNADITRLELSFNSCHLPSSYTIWDGVWIADRSTNITVENCSNDGINTYVNEYRDVAGRLQYNDSVYFDTGYEDDEASARLSIVLSPEDHVSQSLVVASSQIGGFFTNRGIKVLTLELVENFTNPLNASEIWLELYYYKDNGDALRTLDKSTKEYIKATFTELPAGVGLGNWIGEPAGSRSVKLVASISVNHPGLFYGVVKLAKYESGKVVHIDPEFQIS
jgi:hypothetical protein